MHVRLFLCHCVQTGEFIGQVTQRIRTVHPAVRVYNFFFRSKILAAGACSVICGLLTEFFLALTVCMVALGIPQFLSDQEDTSPPLTTI
jgi:predicted phage tail protein